MAELIAATDADGNIVGLVDREVAHRDGIWHATVHVWVLDVFGRVLLQERSSAKSTYPGWWDGSCAGHVASDDEVVRELAEELGVEVDPAELVGPRIVKIVDDVGGRQNREHARVYRWQSEHEVDDFVFADGEVSALAALPVEDVYRLFAGENVTAEVYRPGVSWKREVLDASKVVDISASFSAAFPRRHAN